MRVKFHFPLKNTKLTFFRDQASLKKKLAKQKSLVFVQDAGVSEQVYIDQSSYVLPSGEACKQWQELEKLLNFLAQKNIERSTTMIVAGGGAALDLGSLAASLYRRGLPLVLVPTTLLAMVDASVGGKTAIDNGFDKELKKNFVGTFYPAQEVWINLDFLKTLPARERISGAGEVWKTLWIGGKKINSKPLSNFVDNAVVSDSLLSLIKDCLEVKKKIVEKDPLDQKRIREILNFGHTVGHVLESLSEGSLSHGEAVLWGMAVETSMLGKKATVMQNEIFSVINSMKLKIPSVFVKNNFLSILQSDKKKKEGLWEISLLLKPGKITRLKKNATELDLAIKAFPEFYRRASLDQQS